MRKVAIQGVRGAFHELAANKYFDNDIKIIECDTFSDLCKALKNNDADCAIMAIENTLAGAILPNYSLLEEHNFNIHGEIYMRIEMNLMTLPGQNIEDLEEVQSHPMAILQCKPYFDKYPNIKLREIEDTAIGAKKLNENVYKNIGIIASETAAELYDLDIIAKGIETDKKNFTRFLILSNDKDIIDSPNKASIVFSLQHQVGSLVDILTILKCHEINMTKIQSSPIIGQPYEYNFHIDLSWENYYYFKHAMDIVERNVAHLRILGEYKAGAKDY